MIEYLEKAYLVVADVFDSRNGKLHVIFKQLKFGLGFDVDDVVPAMLRYTHHRPIPCQTNHVLSRERVMTHMHRLYSNL